MTLTIVCKRKPEFHFKYRALARRVIETALQLEKFPYEVEVELLLTDNERIHEINLEMRGIDDATDVLSFPMLEYGSPGDYRSLEENFKIWANPDTRELFLGDIVISIDKVHAQALEYGHSEKREYAFLIAHSMLHLLGYDHMVPEDASVMEAHQREIMAALGIFR